MDIDILHLSRNVIKCTLGHVRPAKTQISLLRSLSGFWIAKVASFLHVDNNVESDQIAQTDLSLRWAHVLKGKFSQVAAQYVRLLYIITKTYLYNFIPLKAHFYIVKLRFTGVYIIFLFSTQKHRLWVDRCAAWMLIKCLCFHVLSVHCILILVANVTSFLLTLRH